MHERAIWIDYTNWRGERAMRQVVPVNLHWGSTAFHPEPQWLLRAIDLQKDDSRDFAFRDIHGIYTVPPADGVKAPDGGHR